MVGFQSTSYICKYKLNINKITDKTCLLRCAGGLLGNAAHDMH